MTVAHIFGLPIEESALALAPAGAALATGVAVVTRSGLRGITAWFRRRYRAACVPMTMFDRDQPSLEAGTEPLRRTSHGIRSDPHWTTYMQASTHLRALDPAGNKDLPGEIVAWLMTAGRHGPHKIRSGSAHTSSNWRIHDA